MAHNVLLNAPSTSVVPASIGVPIGYINSRTACADRSPCTTRPPTQSRPRHDGPAQAHPLQITSCRYLASTGGGNHHHSAFDIPTYGRYHLDARLSPA